MPPSAVGAWLCLALAALGRRLLVRFTNPRRRADFNRAWENAREVGRPGLVLPPSRAEAEAAVTTLQCLGPYAARLPASCGG
ncbi:MAG: hypothetical protein J3K34DRAFT_466853 [Monoraphidium minutum]|nr:MAG: hypothetical protein J3K34DRAFT_466853 [Monoraphidium minutum]